MRRAIRNITYYGLLGTMMVSCSASDDITGHVDETMQPQVRQVELLMSLEDAAKKSGEGLTRNGGESEFQGMELVVAIPYRTNGGEVTTDDEPLTDLIGADEDNLGKEYETETEKYNTYYVERCHLMTGTDRMLVYGKAKHGTDDPKVSGKLSALPTVRKKTADIQFSLTSIRESTEAHADAAALASYMTNIANTDGWSTTDDATLKSYYLDFIHAGSEGAGLMSGAAVNIKAFVKALKELLEVRSDALSRAIIENIEGTDISGNTYPRSIGLPDGAAVMRWTGERFEVRTTTTTLDNINGINRYTYPAELVFFVDSPIRTSAEEVSKTTYQSNDKLWSTFLDTYYNGSTAVNTNTKAVAVEKPLQYGVANMQLTLKDMSATPLKDAKDEEVMDADMTHLPLTAVIVGGQHTVGFNMKPQGEQTDVDGRFIYDTNIIEGI